MKNKILLIIILLCCISPHPVFPDYQHTNNNIYQNSLNINPLERENLQLKDQLDKVIKQRTYLILFIIIILIVIIFLIYTIKQKNLKNATIASNNIKHLKTENELLKKKHNTTDKTIEEISIRLISYHNLIATLNNSLYQQLQYTMKLFSSIKSLRPYSNSEGKKKINSVISEYNGISKEKNWLVFEQNFTTLYPTFMSNLSKQSPKLTIAEKKICAFIKMGLSTKEITRITLQQKHCIYPIKKRLREKLGVQNNEELNVFLQKIEGDQVKPI